MFFNLIAASLLWISPPDEVIQLNKIEPDYLFQLGPRWDLPHRPKIALALSGGGAKGFVHVGVLQVMEELGLRVDELAGTSIGALVGGLYAIGLDPQTIEQHLKDTDITRLFYNHRARDYTLSLPEQLTDAEGMWRVRFRSGKVVPNTGLLRADRLKDALEGWFARANYFCQGDNSKLPISFTPVAVDLQSAKAVYLRHHNLATSILGSMAVPTGFDPVELDGMLLVDGGILENIPTAALQDRDYDLLIAVDISETLGSAKSGYSLLSLMNRLQLVYFEAQKNDLLELADHVVSPDVAGLSFTDFEQDANDLIARGRIAFEKSWPAIELDLDKIVKYRDRLFVITDFKITGDSDPARLAYAKSQFNVADQKALLTELESGLLRVLETGWYQDAIIRRRGSELLLELIPYGIVNNTVFEQAHLLFAGEVDAIQQRFLGHPFNAMEFERILQERMPDYLSAGNVFTDLRGSGFDAHNGVLTVRFNAPVVRAIAIHGDDLATSKLLKHELVSRFIGKTITVSQLQQFLDRLQRVYALRHMDFFPTVDEQRQVHLEVTFSSQREHLMDLSYAFETNIDHDVSVAYETQIKPPSALYLRAKAHFNRLISEFEFQAHSERRAGGQFGLMLRGKYQDLDLRDLDSEPFPNPVNRTHGGSAAIGIFKRFAHTGMAEVSYSFRRLETELKTATQPILKDDIHGLNLELSWDDLDNFVIPTRGQLFRLRQEVTRDHQKHLRVLLEYRKFQPITAKQILEFRLIAGGNDDEVRPEYRFLAGGPDFFSGTQSMEFVVNNFATLRFAHHVRLTSVLGYDIYLDTIADYGLYADQVDALFDEGDAYGGSLALRTFGNFRNLAFSYGWNSIEGNHLSILFGPKPFSLWRRD